MTEDTEQHFATAYYTIQVYCAGDTTEAAISDLNATRHNLDFVPIGLPDGARIGSIHLSNPQIEDQHGQFQGHYTWDGVPAEPSSSEWLR